MPLCGSDAVEVIPMVPGMKTSYAPAMRDAHIRRTRPALQLRSGAGSLQLHGKQFSVGSAGYARRHPRHVVRHIKGVLAFGGLGGAAAGAGKLRVSRAYVEPSAVGGARPRNLLELYLHGIVSLAGVAGVEDLLQPVRQAAATIPAEVLCS